MNLANKSWNQLHNNIMSVSDGRLHAVYSIWIILANTAYSKLFMDTFRSLGIVLKCRDKSVGKLA